jgi:hypothetical protein
LLAYFPYAEGFTKKKCVTQIGSCFTADLTEFWSSQMY